MFISFSPPASPYTAWVTDAQQVTSRTITQLFQAVKRTYSGMWQDKEAIPQGPVDRVAALGTGAVAAFQAHAASVQYLLTVLPLFDGTADLLAEAQTWQIPEGWTITFNADGSATATPPAA